MDLTITIIGRHHNHNDASKWEYSESNESNIQYLFKHTISINNNCLSPEYLIKLITGYYTLHVLVRPQCHFQMKPHRMIIIENFTSYEWQSHAIFGFHRSRFFFSLFFPFDGHFVFYKILSIRLHNFPLSLSPFWRSTLLLSLLLFF